MVQKKDDIRTLAYVLRRTNYGEADRILNLITPQGKMAVMAKGVRKAKSKLAGGIEMFSLSELQIHRGRSELGVLTGAKMVRYYSRLVGDLERMELAALILKKVAAASENSDAPEWFGLVDQTLSALDDGAAPMVVETWFWLNFARVSGVEANLYRDVGGEKLQEGLRYDWDGTEMALMPRENGAVGAAEIKMMRLMVTMELNVVRRVKNAEEVLPAILPIARAVGKC